jgi:hypothetical protein
MNCFVSGKALKKIVKSTYGALVVRGNTIAFYDPLYNETLSVEGCKPAIKGFLFVSYSFNRIKKLPEDAVYELEAEGTSHLKITNYYTGETVDLIPGILVELP